MPKNNEYLVSIVTVCFNDISGLKETHDSIISNKNFLDEAQWVVIDGGSSDGSKEYLAGNPRVDVFVSEPDSGIYNAMNKGISYCAGKYIIFMNAGDRFTDSCDISDFLKNSESDVILCDALIKFPRGKRYRRAKSSSYIRYSMPTIHQSVVFSAQILERFHYDEKFKICGDYALISSIYKGNGSFEHYPDCLSIFSIGGTSTLNVWQLGKEAMSIQRDILELPLPYVLFSWIKRSVSLNLTLLLYTLTYK